MVQRVLVHRLPSHTSVSINRIEFIIFDSAKYPMLSTIEKSANITMFLQFNSVTYHSEWLGQTYHLRVSKTVY